MNGNKPMEKPHITIQTTFEKLSELRRASSLKFMSENDAAVLYKSHTEPFAN